MEFLKRLYREEEGQALTEYGLVLAVVAIGAIIALTGLRTELIALFGKIAGALRGA